MIRPLRQRHRLMVISLAVTLPAAFAVGVASRRAVPSTPVAALGFSSQVREQDKLWTRNDLWEKQSITTRLLQLGGGQARLGIELTSLKPVARPDVLVYWAPGEGRLQDSLPNEAFLLGSLETSSSGPLALPGTATNQAGVLVLYSLADQEIVAVSKPFSAR